MSLIPLLGAQQRAAAEKGAPRLRTRSKFCWRGSDGVLSPLNEGLVVRVVQRTSAVTIYASDGTSGLLSASAPAFSSVDFDGDGVRECDALELMNEEANRYVSPDTEQIMWDLDPETWLIRWIERGAAAIPNAPYFSLTNNAATGAYFGLFGDGAGNAVFRHYNGTTTVEASRAVVANARYEGVITRDANGAVQFALIKNGGTEQISAKSAAAEPLAWGGGSGVQLRINEFGNTVRGVQSLLYLACYRGVLSRQRVLELL